MSTVLDAVEAISRNLGDLIFKGTTDTSATSLMVVTSDIPYTYSGKLIGKHVIVTQTLDSYDRIVMGGTGSTDTRLLVNRGWYVAPTGGYNVYLFDRLSYFDYKNSIDRVFGVARLKSLSDRVGTLSLVATTYSYSVPSGMEFIQSLRLIPTTGTDFSADDTIHHIMELTPSYFRIHNSKIVFNQQLISLDDFNNYIVEVVGQDRPALLGTYNTSIPDNLFEYVIAAATTQLSRRFVSTDDEWKSKFGAYKLAMDELEPYTYVQGHGLKTS